MSIVAAKCTACGAPLEVNDARKEGFCPFCGTKYVTQDVIQNTVNNNYVTQNIGSAVFQGGDTVETLYGRFDAFCRIGDDASAAGVAQTMCEKYPQKAVSWYCAALADRAADLARIAAAGEKIDAMPLRMQLPAPASLIERTKGLPVQEARQVIRTAHDDVLRNGGNNTQLPQFAVRDAAPEAVRKDLANAKKFLTEPTAPPMPTSSGRRKRGWRNAKRDTAPSKSMPRPPRARCRPGSTRGKPTSTNSRAAKTSA